MVELLGTLESPPSPLFFISIHGYSRHPKFAAKMSSNNIKLQQRM